MCAARCLFLLGCVMVIVVGLIVVGAVVVCAGCALVGVELGRSVLMP